MRTTTDLQRESHDGELARAGDRVRLGALPSDAGTTFALWSTRATRAAVRLFKDAETPMNAVAMTRRDDGVFSATAAGLGAGTLYKFELDGQPTPDPYARFLPYGVHGPARVEPMRRAEPLPGGLSMRRAIFYEIHVGAFTPDGTYRAAIDKLPYLASLGVTAVELMPIAAFAGARGWGYDGVAQYAPFADYGDPEDLRAFIAAAHALGIGVILDVVYNHFGPSGNYLANYSPEYFTDEHKTAWGDAPNYANPFLRRYVLDNAWYWLVEFGFDGLRLDATHGIVDDHRPHVLEEIASLAHRLEPPRIVVAEDDRNDPTLVTGVGLDGLWADDFHHDVRVTLTREHDGYYRAYTPGLEELSRTIGRGWLYEGQTYPLTGASRGASADALAAENFIYCIQNHDQIGNRAFGSRLNHDVPLDMYAAVSMLLLFLPMTPILFMGQEWAATTPFLFFTDHDSELGRLISEGRRREFQHFEGFRDGGVAVPIPDPQAVATFTRSKLRWSELDAEPHAQIVELYRAMIHLRRTDPVLGTPDRRLLRCVAAGASLRVARWRNDQQRTLVINFGDTPAAVEPTEASMCLVTSRPGAWSAGAVQSRSAVLFSGDVRNA